MMLPDWENKSMKQTNSWRGKAPPITRVSSGVNDSIMYAPYSVHIYYALFDPQINRCVLGGGGARSEEIYSGYVAHSLQRPEKNVVWENVSK